MPSCFPANIFYILLYIIIEVYCARLYTMQSIYCLKKVKSKIISLFEDIHILDDSYKIYWPSINANNSSISKIVSLVWSLVSLWSKFDSELQKRGNEKKNTFNQQWQKKMNWNIQIGQSVIIQYAYEAFNIDFIKR